MSEVKADYDSQLNTLTIEAFKKRSCALSIEHPDFVQPTPQEVKELRNILGFSQVELAKLTGVKWTSKGASAVRKWETTEGKEKRSISLSAWQLMLIKSGLVVVEPVDLN